MIRGEHDDKEHLVQFWLRLPLYIDQQVPQIILCYDSCVSVGDCSEIPELRSDIRAAAHAG